MTHKCMKCEVVLNDENWGESCRKKGDYICKDCHREQSRVWGKYKNYKQKANSTRNNRKNGQRPMSENKECASYLGVCVAERVLRHVFKDVVRMPYGNPGYDFVCNRGYLVDSKSSCIIKSKNGWSFAIRRNIVADYFLCLAFDNREYLNPLHVWLIHGGVLSHLTGASISPSTIHKWDEYKLDIDKVISCCDTLKGDQ